MAGPTMPLGVWGCFGLRWGAGWAGGADRCGGVPPGREGREEMDCPLA